MIGRSEPSMNREYIGRVFAVAVLGGRVSVGGTLVAAVILGVAESLTSTFFGPSWSVAVSFGLLLLVLAVRPAGLFGREPVRGRTFGLVVAGIVGAGVSFMRLGANHYYYFAAYVILQYVVLATAWNILGGYTGYVNFGTPAFFALGAYTSVALIKGFAAPLPVLLAAGAAVAGLVGLGIGFLTLRLRGVFFSIATLALAVVLQTMAVNWDYVGGARGSSVARPARVPFFGSYVEFLFAVVLLLAVLAIAVAWWIETSRIGRGLAAIRDNEEAAECMGVPTLRLKRIATTVSGSLMGIAGAPFPYYVTFVEPGSAFNLDYAVNSLAMPMIGGTTTWVGPVIGAILLGTAQQVATVTISSALNLLIVGIILVAFVILAPEGILGLVQRLKGGARAVEQAQEILRMMGLEAKARAAAATLTQIEMRKLELGRAMAAKPKLLVADEAMAGLSSAEVDDILDILFRLNARGITIIMIEHIMRAVMRFSERIAVLDAGEKIAEGGPEAILANEAVERAYLGQ